MLLLLKKVERNRKMKKNYFAFWILFTALSVNATVFDAWDTVKITSKKDSGKRKISTKITGKTFELTVASLSKDKKEYKEFNGTVCIKAIDKKGILKTKWHKLLFKNEKQKNIKLLINEAVGGENEAKIEFDWMENKDTTCPITAQIKDTLTKSSDSFSIKPQKFIFIYPKQNESLISQHHYKFKKAIKALSFDGKSTVKTYNASFELKFEKRDRNMKIDNALKGDLKSQKPNFKNGVSDLDFSFTDTAMVTLVAEDKKWCKIDEKDTKEEERTIYAEVNVSFALDHFELSFLNPPTIENNSTGFTYLSNDLNMSASLKNLSLKITAKGEQNAILQNYQDPKEKYFANNLNINSNISITPKDKLLLADEPKPLLDHNLSFSKGNAVLDYKTVRFNYKKDYKNPINPFVVKGKECNISIDINDTKYPHAKGKIKKAFEKEALFYYARVETFDLKTDSNKTKNKIYIEVYCDKNCLGFKNLEQRSIDWYINKNDGFSDNVLFYPRISISYNDAVAPYCAVKNTNTAKGVITFDVINTIQKDNSAYFHIDIPSWLWSSRYYDYGFDVPNSNCAKHPCFHYSFKNGSKTSSKEIKTGKYQGIDLLDDHNTSIKNRYLKVLR